MYYILRSKLYGNLSYYFVSDALEQVGLSGSDIQKVLNNNLPQITSVILNMVNSDSNVEVIYFYYELDEPEPMKEASSLYISFVEE